MNDPFADRLRSLKPGALPDALRERLALPPAPERTAVSRRIVFAAFVTAAAAAAVIILLSRPAGVSPPAAVPAFAGTEASRVTEVRPLSVVTDSANRTWKLMEVSWVEENTLVASARPVAVQLQDQYRTIVPVAVHFD